MTVGEAWVAIFQRSGAPPTAAGQPIVLNLARPCRVFISYSAMHALLSADEGAAPRYRYVLLVNGQPIAPTVPAIESSVGPGGAPLFTTAMPTLAAGIHRIQVAAQGSEGAVFSTHNQTLTVICPLQ